MKRTMPFDLDADDNDDVLRSMARRKKNAKPEIHACDVDGCDKEFKRPCDLTKHVKTHERPWKCSEEKCKYYELGWPTEKERDRHVNDKHSSTPSLYRCLFEPCPYTSKRESNCKQHMEKAHGWEYVRSKNNGKGRASSSVVRLPKGSVPPSPSSTMLTPYTPIAPSPSSHYYSESSHSASRRGSMAPPAGPSSHFGTPQFANISPEWNTHFNMDFNFGAMASSSTTFPITPAMSDDRRQSMDGSDAYSEHIQANGLQLDGSAFDDAISRDDLTFTNGFDFNNFQYPQHPTPNSTSGPSSGFAAPHNLSLDSGIASGSNAPLTSPGAQLDNTFISPNLYDSMQVDEGFGDFNGHNEDFTLFGGGAGAPSTSGEMFPSLQESNEASWGNFNMHAPSLQSGDSALRELFPGLN